MSLAKVLIISLFVLILLSLALGFLGLLKQNSAKRLYNKGFDTESYTIFYAHNNNRDSI